MRIYPLLSLAIVLSLLPVNTVSAQAQRTSYQVFQLDTLTEIELQLFDDYKVESWAAKNLMTQSTIKLYNGSEGILQHFVDNGRYAVEVDTIGSRLRLVSKDQERKKIKTKEGECFEVIELILYLPEEFEPRSEGLYIKKVD